MKWTRTVAGLLASVLLPLSAAAQGANARVAPGSPTADKLPVYEIDPTWPPTLPNDWILGDIRGLFVDDRDHLWVIHHLHMRRPREMPIVRSGKRGVARGMDDVVAVAPKADETLPQ